MTAPKRNLTDEDVQRIAAAIAPTVAPTKPLHEMTEWERTAYANETWAAAGIIPDRPNAGRTISGGGQ